MSGRRPTKPPARAAGTGTRTGRGAWLAFCTLMICGLAVFPAHGQNAGETVDPQGRNLPQDPAESALPADLTPMGAIRAGTANRFIPPWEGGLSAPVKGFEPKRAHPDPYFEDARWFTVTSDELERYKVRLSWGLRELLRRSERFEIPLYPGHRSAAAPLAIYNASVENRRTAQLSENNLVITGARVGFPFPEPQNGAQAMWNHVMRWRGGSMVQLLNISLPDKHGNLVSSLYREDVDSPYSQGLPGPVITRYRLTGLRPQTIADSGLIIVDTMDPLRSPRAVYYLAPGSQRAVLAGEFGHGVPDPASQGIRTADMLDMFSGPLDWFDFKLIGRRAMYVPYNAYRIIQDNVDPEDFLWAEHPNPSFLRYELHRVWIVDAKLKRGFRHPYPERVYYLDEDSWQILMAEHFDANYKLARYAEAHTVTLSQVPALVPAIEITYDFNDGRYVMSGRDNKAQPPIFGKPFNPAYFDKQALEPQRNRF